MTEGTPGLLRHALDELGAKKQAELVNAENIRIERSLRAQDAATKNAADQLLAQNAQKMKLTEFQENLLPQLNQEVDRLLKLPIVHTVKGVFEEAVSLVDERGEHGLVTTLAFYRSDRANEPTLFTFQTNGVNTPCSLISSSDEILAHADLVQKKHLRPEQLLAVIFFTYENVLGEESETEHFDGGETEYVFENKKAFGIRILPKKSKMFLQIGAAKEAEFTTDQDAVSRFVDTMAIAIKGKTYETRTQLHAYTSYWPEQPDTGGGR